MSLTDRLSGLVRTALRSPQARRAGRDLLRSAQDALRDRRRDAGTATPAPGPRDPGAQPPPSRPRDPRALADRPSHPPLPLLYEPVEDDRADPGEIVWAWVAFEEDPSQGKDRPVLVLGREDATVGGHDGSGEVHVCLMLTSHDRGTGTHRDGHGHTWVDIGTGSWDRQRRPSEVRIDRLLRIPTGAVRREGSGLDQERFEQVAAAVRREHGWS